MLALLLIACTLFFAYGVIQIYRAEKEIAWDFVGCALVSIVLAVIFAASV